MGDMGEVGKGVEEHDGGSLDLVIGEANEGFEFEGTVLNTVQGDNEEVVNKIMVTGIF